MAMTVTASSSATGTVGTSLKVMVLTGATESGGANNTGAGVSPGQVSVTPAFSHSLITDVILDYQSGTLFTAAANNTLTDNSALGSTGKAFADGDYSGTVTAGSAVTVGASAPASNCAIAAYEVPASGGSTPAIDGSTPAVVQGGSASQTTASFTPPAGAVLVALVSQFVASGPQALSVTDSSGLTWTSRASVPSAGGAAAVGIWTATVPSGSTSKSSSDTGTGADTQGPVGLADVEAGTGAEAQQLTARISALDTGSGIDAQGPVGVSAFDAGTGTDTQGPVGLAGSDTGAGTDAQQLTARVSAADTGTGAEGPVVIGLASSDAGTGSESQSQSPQTIFHVSDSDRARGQEGDIEPAASSDSGTGAEGSSYPLGIVAAADSGTGAEAQSVFVALNLVADSDTGTGAEAWSTSGPHYDTDAATGADSQLGVFLFAQSDTGTGADSQVYALEVFPFPAPWEFAQPQGGVFKVVIHGRTVREFRGEPREWRAAALELHERTRFSATLLAVADSDAGTGADANGPTATVRAYATGPRITCETSPAAASAVEIDLVAAEHVIVMQAAGPEIDLLVTQH